MKNEIRVDILIAGGGSAGFGAAYNACLHSKGKYSIAVIDCNSVMGGTSTVGGVNTWEMGIGGPGIHTELAYKLLAMNKKAAILKGNWKPLVRNWPYAIASVTDKYKYEDTLKAAGVHDRVNNHNSFIFEPDAMSGMMLEILDKVGGVNFTFFSNERISGVDVVKSNNGTSIGKVHTDKSTFIPGIVIDCTGDIVLARKAGCETGLGENNSGTGINGVTQIYRVEKKIYSAIDSVPINYCPSYSDRKFVERLNNVNVISSIDEYPNGDLNINPLPTMNGDEFFAGNQQNMIQKCLGRVFLHWRRLQEDSTFMRDFSIKEIFPMIGIRESYRLKGEYILTKDDLLAGYNQQNKKNEIVAFSDHPVDIHGNDSPGISILNKPYGIPYSCLLPKEITNMLVACRGTSFDRTAAASCRLSRTMISLGEAAGTAAVNSLDKKCTVQEADIKKIRSILHIPEFTEVLNKEYYS